MGWGDERAMYIHSHGAVCVFRMNKIQLQAYADFVAKRFNDEHIAAPLRWLWLGNYVDSILRYVDRTRTHTLQHPPSCSY